MDCHVYVIRKAIRPLFTDPVTYVEDPFLQIQSTDFSVLECICAGYSNSHSPVRLCFYTVMSENQDIFYEGILIFLVSVKGYTLVSRLFSCFYLWLFWLTVFTIKTSTSLSYVTHRVKTSNFNTFLKFHFIVSLSFGSHCFSFY